MHPLMSEAEVRYRQRRFRDDARRQRLLRQPTLERRWLRLRTRLSGRGLGRPSLKAVLDALRLPGRPVRVRIGGETRD
jgi:hypothetical protein